MRTKTDKNPLNAGQLIYQFIFVSVSPLAYRNVFTNEYSPSGHFPPTALWVGSVSPPMNTITSRYQFNPIRMGGNLVVTFCSQKFIGVAETELKN